MIHYCCDKSAHKLLHYPVGDKEAWVAHIQSPIHGKSQGYLCGGCHHDEWFKTQAEVWAHMRAKHPRYFVQAHMTMYTSFNPTTRRRETKWACKWCNAHGMITLDAFDHMVAEHLDKVDVLIDEIMMEGAGCVKRGWITQYPKPIISLVLADHCGNIQEIMNRE